MKHVVMFSEHHCTQCEHVNEIFAYYGISVFDGSAKQTKDESCVETNSKKVCSHTYFIDGKYLGTCIDIESMHKIGTLKYHLF